MTSPTAVSLSGSAEDLRLDDLLVLVGRSNADGVLAIEGSTAGHVSFVDGAITWAEAPGSPSIRHVIDGAAEIDPSRWSGTDLAAIARSILANGEVEPARFRAALYENLVEVMVGLALGLAGSSYAYRTDVAPTDWGICVSPAELMEQVQDRLESWRRIAVALPNMGMIPTGQPTLASDQRAITLTSIQWTVLHLIDDRRDVMEIIAESRLGAFSVASTLCHLAEAGAISFRAPEPEGT